MYFLLILAMSVMAGATLVRAAKACFEGVWLERWKSAATPEYASRCGLHHVHSSDGRALPYRSQDRLRKNVHRRSDGAVQLYTSYALSTSWTHCLEVREKEARAPQDDGGRRQMYRNKLTSITAALATLQARVNGKGAGKTRGKANEGALREKEKENNSEGDVLIIARIRPLLKIVDAGQKVTHAQAIGKLQEVLREAGEETIQDSTNPGEAQSTPPKALEGTMKRLWKILGRIQDCCSSRHAGKPG